MKNKQTAVEWLEQQLYKSSWDEMTHEERMNICCTAKLMEREQIIDIIKLVIEKEYHEQSWAKCGSISYIAEQYYNETFKSE